MSIKFDKIIVLVSFVILLFACTNTLAQQGDENIIYKRNAVFVELFGSSVYVYNLTYDREIWVRDNKRVNAALGLQFFPKLGLLQYNLVSFSPQFSFLYGKTHCLEIGAGLSYDLFFKNWGLPLRLGYRYQPMESGFFFRAALTPIITNSYPVNSVKLTVVTWGGIGLGYSFRDRRVDKVKGF